MLLQILLVNRCHYKAFPCEKKFSDWSCIFSKAASIHLCIAGVPVVQANFKSGLALPDTKPYKFIMYLWIPTAYFTTLFIRHWQSVIRWWFMLYMLTLIIDYQIFVPTNTWVVSCTLLLTWTISETGLFLADSNCFLFISNFRSLVILPSEYNRSFAAVLL